MIKVGVRNLKNELSHYLQYVKNGEKVIVTEHNKIIAEICVPEKKKTLTGFEEKLLQLSKEGEIILAEQDKSGLKLPKINEKLDWESTYNEIRADRI
jgi:antitoxin (DNA-binding transcriptional repressor) of toxin-antitoxin stability system